VQRQLAEAAFTVAGVETLDLTPPVTCVLAIA
jgi:hypothetical protein